MHVLDAPSWFTKVIISDWLICSGCKVDTNQVTWNSYMDINNLFKPNKGWTQTTYYYHSRDDKKIHSLIIWHDLWGVSGDTYCKPNVRNTFIVLNWTLCINQLKLNPQKVFALYDSPTICNVISSFSSATVQWPVVKANNLQRCQDVTFSSSFFLFNYIVRLKYTTTTFNTGKTIATCKVNHLAVYISIRYDGKNILKVSCHNGFPWFKW